MQIRKVCILGTGPMGAGIVQVAAQAGFSVTLRDTEKRFVARGMDTVEKYIVQGIEKGKISESEASQIRGRITGTTDLQEAIEDADLVIEAIIELMEMKKMLFREVAPLCKPETIFASNSYGLSISEMASVIRRPEKVLGIHFFSPVPAMKLVELVRGMDTSEATLATARKFVKKIGKTPVEVKDAPGFAVNRILCPMMNEAVFVLAEGIATAEDIDTAMKLGSGHPLGPLALADMIGLDLLLQVMEGFHAELGEDKYRPAPLLRKMVNAGRLGRKSGRGFFDYTGQDKK